jgi:hypothetical protein
MEWMEAGVVGLDEGSAPQAVRRTIADDGSGRPVESGFVRGGEDSEPSRSSAETPAAP